MDYSHNLTGRTVIYTHETEVTEGNIVDILTSALPKHRKNEAEIDYLWKYYKGRQPILDRIKTVRPEINNKIVENRANEIVTFKTGYLMGEPLQYVAKSENDANEKINRLNSLVFAEEKPAKDRELAEWFHICGTAFRMVLPDERGEEDDAPFEIYTLDPRFTFLVYNSGIGNKPLVGVTFFRGADKKKHYLCYTDTMVFEIVENKIISSSPHILGGIPIIEYPLNNARIGAFEVVLSMLDEINLLDSDRIDGTEQFIQSLLVIKNLDISKEQIKNLEEMGLIMFKDADPSMKGDVEYITPEMNQTQTQTLKDDLYETVLTICGMPNRNGGSSTSDTGTAVIFRDGWSDAEARAKDTEMIFKKSERAFLKILLNILSVLSGLELKPNQIEIRFTRRNYENIQAKAQVLDLMLKNNRIHPRLGFEHCGMFPDADLAYTISEEYYQKMQEKQSELEREAVEIQGNTAGNTTESAENSESGRNSSSKDRKTTDGSSE